MALADDVQRLARIPLLAQMEKDALRLIAFSAEARILRKGDIVFKAGEPSDGGFIVVSGSIALEPPSGSAVQIVGPDALVGELAMIAPSVRPVTATAREATTVLKISRRLFHRVLAEHPEFAVGMRQILERRLVELTSELRSAKEWSSG